MSLFILFARGPEIPLATALLTHSFNKSRGSDRCSPLDFLSFFCCRVIDTRELAGVGGFRGTAYAEDTWPYRLSLFMVS